MYTYHVAVSFCFWQLGTRWLSFLYRMFYIQTLTSGKYGPNILPATIDAEEYEAIFAELSKDFNLLKSHIESLQQEQKDIDEEKEKNEHTDGTSYSRYTAAITCIIYIALVSHMYA